MRYDRLLLLSFVLLMVFTNPVENVMTQGTSPLQTNSICAEEPEDWSEVRVAVYEGYGSDLCINSRIALVNMFTWMGFQVDVVNSSQIYMGEEIWNYDILAVPDGLAPRFETRLGSLGLGIIKDWVSKGGCYFGVRAGATLACAYSVFETADEEYVMKLFNGTGYGPIAELDEACVTKVNIDTDALSTFTEVPSSLDVFYRVSRYFVAAEGQEAIPIGTYDANGGMAMLAFHHGSGCAFLTGLDPEFEENSDRDGTAYYDEYNDPDSEWPLMLDVCKWMIQESEWNLPATTTETTTNTTETTTGTNTSALAGNEPIPMTLYAAIGGVGILAIVVIFIGFKKK